MAKQAIVDNCEYCMRSSNFQWQRLFDKHLSGQLKIEIMIHAYVKFVSPYSCPSTVFLLQKNPIHSNIIGSGDNFLAKLLPRGAVLSSTLLV